MTLFKERHFNFIPNPRLLGTSIVQLTPRKHAAWFRLLASVLYSSNVLACCFIFLVKSCNSIMNLSFLLIADVVGCCCYAYGVLLLMVHYYSFIFLALGCSPSLLSLLCFSLQPNIYSCLTSFHLFLI